MEFVNARARSVSPGSPKKADVARRRHRLYVGMISVYCQHTDDVPTSTEMCVFWKIIDAILSDKKINSVDSYYVGDHRSNIQKALRTLRSVGILS